MSDDANEVAADTQPDDNKLRILLTEVTWIRYLYQSKIDCLIREGIIFAGDLAQKTERELLNIPKFGPKSVNCVKQQLAEWGLNIGMAPSDERLRHFEQARQAKLDQKARDHAERMEEVFEAVRRVEDKHRQRYQLPPLKTEELEKQIIDAGYRTLAKERHPDKGGSTDAMVRLNQARERLKR